jgi:hypothetical protein
MKSQADIEKISEKLFERLLESLKKVYKKKTLTVEDIKNIIKRDNSVYLED